MNPTQSPSLIDRAVLLARALQRRAAELQTASERRQQSELDRMLQTPGDKATLVQLTDQAFRSRTASRVAEQFTYILDVQGIPRFFSPIDRALIAGFQTFGGWLPGVSVPLVKEHMQQETANVVLPADPELLRKHLEARQADGVRMNLNFLGEALLGEKEALHRLEKYLAALQMPEVEVLSVKISTLYSQISPIAREHTLFVLCDRLERLYREAAHLRFRRADGSEVPKFVYLDMEEYRDLELTAAAFMQTLDRPGLGQVSAGIALQAYIPDSAEMQHRINAWARARVAKGGAPVTIRIVKGANMEMERVEASLRDWPQAPYKTKRETDANYKKMLQVAMEPENLKAVRVGIASHNLFDLAYGLVLAARADTGDQVQFEMLEGMANHQRRALLEETRNLLLYAPACRKSEFLNAIGYLIRRMDENTGEQNFLRHAFKLHVDSPEWDHLEAGFREAFDLPFSIAPRRIQNRTTEKHGTVEPERPWQEFENEPDTDFAIPANSEWAADLVADQSTFPPIPIVLAGSEICADRVTKPCVDPSRPGVELCRYSLASEDDVNRALECAASDPDGWRTMSVDQRNAVLGKVAAELRAARGRLTRAAIANGGKTIAEVDPEISEAVDFVEFYPRTVRSFHELSGARAEPLGTVVVVPPWNFPVAIPCGGIAAALAAGNTVILKPASDTVLIAWELCQCFWRAGVSKHVLQFLPCPGSAAGAKLVSDPRVNAVILTGGTETALRMLAAKPDLRLFAETGGKNATIVTALSDREQAVKHVVHSAFSHAGQKCSATSLLLLEAEVFDDAEFKRMLCDAIESVRVGSAWQLETRMSPLIRPPSGELEQALMTLEPGESWAVMPHRDPNQPHQWTPAVKWDARPDSFAHCTEFFGPVLSVMRFETLDEAIDLVNATGYGLTSGLQSLDDREIARWKASIRAGNLYINKPTVGAIVLRQPFGGWNKSSFGPGMKAGGPNYVAQFLKFTDKGPTVASNVELQNPALASLAGRLRKNVKNPGDLARLNAALASYDRAWADEFSREHDHLRLLGEDNIRRYIPYAIIRVRLQAQDSFLDIISRVAAARVTGARVLVSHAPDFESENLALLDECTQDWAAAIEILAESDDALADVVINSRDQRVRYAAPDRVPAALRQAATRAHGGTVIIDQPVLGEGRIELLWYVREQSISYAYHRYGNLGARAGEARREPR
jgi:RHH-type proline utilization regulon transcriptional repressor/proline dehydrogenase/delta 1-pyrroline-5-carboxylate dehydrogenase